MINDECLMIGSKNNLLKKLHYLSLDVVVGAVASSWMFWKLPDGITKPDVPSLLILGICTWIIYILDRLLDNIKSEPQDARHEFHFQHQYYLQITIIVLFFVAFTFVFFLPKNVIYYGIGLSIFLVIYFIILKKSSQNTNYQYFKEIYTAILYSLSVVGSAFSTKQNSGFIDYLAGFNFFLLVHQSILIFSFYEAKSHPETKNLASKLGRRSCTYLIIGVCVFITLGNILDTSFFTKKVILIETLMSICSVLIFVFQEKLAKNENYRWLGEMVFWIPILLIFF
jgi:cell division protein FtsW (lipid II flippase)